MASQEQTVPVSATDRYWMLYCSHRPLKRALLASLVIHIALIAVLPARLERMAKRAVPVYQVKLIEEQPPKPPPPKPKEPAKKPAPPKPPQKPKPVPKKTTTPPTPKKEPKKSKVTQKRKKPPTPKKEEPKPTPPPPPPAPPPPPPKVEPKPEVEVTSSLPQWYYETIRTKVWRNWKEPAGIMPGPKGLRVVITFSILESGRISAPTVTTRSGDERLDLSALRAVYDSDPFPELPPEYKDDKLLVRFSFVYGEKTDAE